MHLSDPRRSHGRARRGGTSWVLFLLACLCLRSNDAIAGPATELEIARLELDARVDTHLSAQLRQEARGGTTRFVPQGESGLQIIVRGDVDRAALEAAGAIVSTVAGRVITAEIAADGLANLLDVPGVEELRAPRRLETLLDKSAPAVGADDGWEVSGPPFVPPYPGVTGSGVVVGIVDTGIDLDHEDFRNSNGSTRIRYLWDQFAYGPSPPGFTYGQDWSASEINAGQCTADDPDGHGTHTAGIAAGNGRATGNGQPAYRHVGIAPEANLVVVKSRTWDYAVIDAVRYVFERAAEMQEPAVVLVAMGNHWGGHDGTYAVDEALSALTGPGRLIVAPVGNDGAEAPRHARAIVGVGGYQTIGFSIPPLVTTYDTDWLEIEGWHDGTEQFRVKLTGPTGGTTGWVSPGQSVGLLGTPDGALRVKNAVEVNSKGARKIQVSVWEGYGAQISSGNWTVEVQHLAGTANGPLDAWICGWLLPLSGATSPAFTSCVDMSRLVRSPASADAVISVGAYITKTWWPNVLGSYGFYSGYPLFIEPSPAAAPFTSRGPRRDGVVAPDFTAPGMGVMAALSAAAAPMVSPAFVDPDGRHRILKGTSMAAAHVAGGLALLLEQDPDLNPGQARALLRQRARVDSWTGAVPNDIWGYGKLDLFAPSDTGVEALDENSEPMSPFPNPSRGSTTFSLSLSSEEVLAGGSGRSLRIFDVRGREVATLDVAPVTGEQFVTWNGISPADRPAPPGVYFARLVGKAGTKDRIWHFVRVR